VKKRKEMEKKRDRRTKRRRGELGPLSSSTQERISTNIPFG